MCVLTDASERYYNDWRCGGSAWECAVFKGIIWEDWSSRGTYIVHMHTVHYIIPVMDSSVGICIFGESQGWCTWRLYNKDGKKRGPREVA